MTATTPSQIEAAAAAYPTPTRRPLQIFAFDPMVARLSGSDVVTLSVPYEPLDLGPSGELLQVIDFDGAAGVYYEPVNLDDPRVLINDGLSPSEADPRFHQQMVYAVISALLENFQGSLGRRFRWRGYERLPVFPHAFAGANAMFDPKLAESGALLFGYFQADARNPGRNLPRQTVFSCLSHDVIVHEATHAIVHRVRSQFDVPSNKDVYAFHEGFADLVALLQHFTLPGVVERYIAQTRADLHTKSPLVELAMQFGESNGLGEALRSAIDEEPDPTAVERTFEPHHRGAILVAAVFDGFFAAYQAAIADLLRLATNGSGVLPAGALHPDLVRRVAVEAQKTAQRVLTMCIRGLEYLAPVDVTFSDFLRAVVTADRDLYPRDTMGIRAAVVEGFRKRGLFPTGVTSLADDALTWPHAAALGLPPLPASAVDALVAETVAGLQRDTGSRSQVAESNERLASARQRERDGAFAALGGYAKANASKLDLAVGVSAQPHGAHAIVRVGDGAQPRVDVVVQFLQRNTELEAQRLDSLGGIHLSGGTTVVADVDGQIRYIIPKALPQEAPSSTGEASDVSALRLIGIEKFVDEFDALDMLGPWTDRPDRVAATLNFRYVDGGLQ